MERILDILIPVYGKDPDSIRKNYQKIIEELPENIGIVFSYKNSTDNKLNYDFLKDYERENIIVIKNKYGAKKTEKLKMALEKSKAHYIIAMDAHHRIDLSKVLKFIKFLENCKEKEINLIWNKGEWSNEDTSKTSKRGPFGVYYTFSAGKYILSRSKLQNLSKKVNYDIIFGDDYTFGLFASLTEDFKVSKWKGKFYIRTYGEKVSGTHFWYESSTETKEQMLRDLKTLFDFYFEWYLSMEEPISKVNLKEFSMGMYFVFKLIYKVQGDLLYGTKNKFLHKNTDSILEKLYGKKSKLVEANLILFRKNATTLRQILRFNLFK